MKPDVVDFPRYRTHPSKSLLESRFLSSEKCPDIPTPVSPKKKLILSSLDKERLLNWDLAAIPGQLASSAKAVEQVSDHSRLAAHVNGPEREPDAEADHNPLSNLQVLTGYMRRSFSGAVNKPNVIRRDRPVRARPLSEGSFSFLSARGRGEEATGSAAASGEPQTRRSEITAMLEQVTIGNRSSGASKDDMASLPPRKLNFFSSMRLKRKEGADQGKMDDQEKEIWSVLTKLRNKGEDFYLILIV